MKKYFFIILSLLVFTSCKKWLDVKPQSEIPGADLFQTQEGFQESLNGVYTRCTQDDIYGGELTSGLTDVLSQNYYFDNNAMSYQATSRYEYKDGDFIRRKDNIWKGLYSGIVNANLILGAIDEKKSIFTGNNYALIKGEALALRAYLHFDIFRLFGSYTAGSVTGIPYVTTYSNRVTAMSSADEALGKMLTDLTAAKELLRNADSIRGNTYKVGYPASDTATETAAKSLFQQNRRHRLNYYAVCGEMARIYLYKGDKVNALANAEEVINSNKFRWTAGKDFNNVDLRLKDRILYNELVFGWYIAKQEEKMVERFEKKTNSLHVDQVTLDGIYEANGVGGEDRRFKQWFQVTSADLVALLKYKRNPDAKEEDDEANIHPLMAPAIRLSEMYYIAAECTYAANPSKAIGYFNTVLTNRGIGFPPPITNESQFITELLKEARKEWYGEGQIFYMYKRLNKSIVGQRGAMITPSKDIFVLPLPSDEIEFGGR